jgi:hypothetical protein
MARNSIQIRGADRLIRRFQNFKDEIEREVEKELIATAKTELETKAKESLTEKGHVDTGRLRASIYVKSIREQTNSYSDHEGNHFVCNIHGNIGKMKISFGTDVPYAKKIERLDSFIYNNFNASKPIFKRNINNVLNRLCRQYS